VTVLSTPLPDDELIYLVTGNEDRETFAISRRAGTDAMASFLESIGYNIKDFRSILDFGCGCGRLLAGWEGMLHPEAALRGCDLNDRLVEFCRANIKFAEVIKSSYLPPLPYRDTEFDLIYAASVYTHMSLPAMLQWTGEIARILKTNGIILVTIHGSYYAKTLSDISKAGSQFLAEHGYYLHLHRAPQDTWEGSNDYATFASPQFMERIFAGFELVRAFPGVSHGPTHFASYQDVMIFRRLAP
jgi:SAM-dependent methyltransferase